MTLPSLVAQSGQFVKRQHIHQDIMLGHSDNRCIIWGWGVDCQGPPVCQAWNHKDAAMHINVLERLALFKVIQAFSLIISNKSVHMVTANITLV